MVVNEKVCTACRAGWHSQCTENWTETALDEACCCGGRYSLLDHLKQELDEEYDTPKKKSQVSFGEVGGALPSVIDTPKYDSGYIPQNAWFFTKNIGDFRDPKSTGHKKGTEMYPTSVGQVCEWANKRDCGGGVVPVLGCMGNPASELHHGPDKNTLNNQKLSRGVGNAENAHVICSFCHNYWHEMNDPYYPEYDRVADQRQPWLPHSEAPWGPQSPSEASLEELLELETKRRNNPKGKSNGRHSEPRLPGDFTPTDDDADE